MESRRSSVSPLKTLSMASSPLATNSLFNCSTYKTPCGFLNPLRLALTGTRTVKLSWHSSDRVAIEVVSEGCTCCLRRGWTLWLGRMGGQISFFPQLQKCPGEPADHDSHNQNPNCLFHWRPPFPWFEEGLFASGREIRNVAPCPSSLLSVRSPPWAWTAQRAMDSPRPAPPHSRVLALSTR